MRQEKRLDESYGFRVVYEDESRYGSAISGACQETVRKLCAPIAEHRRRKGLGAVVADARRLLVDRYAHELAEVQSRPGVLSPEWLYPVPELTRPRALRVERDVNVPVAAIELPSRLAADLASYFGEWQAGSSPPTSAPARRLWDALVDLRILTDADAGKSDPTRRPEAAFVGHASVKIGDGRNSVLVDPFVLPRSPAYPADYQPSSARELDGIDAILVTHCHPDHFDMGTLLRFGAAMPIFVPAVERETVLSVDMAARLEELGFRNVHRLAWFEEATVGRVRVIALPFYGEQPTTGAILHPEVRMLGNTYLVEVAGRRVALTVDSGRDHLGDVHELARDAAERYGPIDVLFGGYRGFGLYPIQYLFSSVASYLTFVPESCWTARQRIMCDADDFLDVAELWQARLAVPYASGGAPWYWMRGLGPRLDGSETLEATDPAPAHVRQTSARRSGVPNEGYVASPVPVSLLRPGDSIRLDSDDPVVQATTAWPY